MPNKKIKKTETRKTQSSSGIKSTSTSPPLGISFSYKYFQCDHSKFSINGKDIDYLVAFLERLKNISSWKFQEFIVNNSKALRCHAIDWKDTTESCFGLPNEEQLIDKPYQFSISSNEHGRVHGFFIEEIFYIVWLDPDHKLYR